MRCIGFGPCFRAVWCAVAVVWGRCPTGAGVVSYLRVMPLQNYDPRPRRALATCAVCMWVYALYDVRGLSHFASLFSPRRRPDRARNAISPNGTFDETFDISLYW